MSQDEQRRAPDIGTRQSEGNEMRQSEAGEIGESGISGSDQPGQFEDRSEHVHSEGSRHSDRY